MKKIRLDELSIIFNRIIKKLEFENYKEIRINEDLYRYIPTEKWSSFDDEIIETGSLFDDVDELLKLVQDIKRPCTYVDFDRMASILRAISKTNNPV